MTNHECIKVITERLSQLDQVLFTRPMKHTTLEQKEKELLVAYLEIIVSKAQPLEHIEYINDDEDDEEEIEIPITTYEKHRQEGVKNFDDPK